MSSRYFADTRAAQAAIGGFFRRLADLEPLVRRLTHDEAMIILLELEQPSFELAIDLSVRPMQVRDSIAIGRGAPSRVGVTVDVDVMHELLLGRLGAGRAMRERRLLLRGSMALVTRFLPLLELSPSLYPDHLRTVARAPSRDAAARPLDAPAQTAARPPRARHRGAVMIPPPSDHAAAVPRLPFEHVHPDRALFARTLQHPTLRRVTRRALRSAAHRAGLAFARLARVDPELSLFELLRAFSEGVERGARPDPSARAKEPAR